MKKMASDVIELSEQIELVTAKSERLRRDMEELKKSVITKKAELAQRRSDTDSAKYGLKAREAKELEAFEASIRRIGRRRVLKQQDMVEGRFSLCKEAAILAGLRHYKRTRSDGKIREYFMIGDKLNIFDLRELHSKWSASDPAILSLTVADAKPEELTASLTQLAYLTARISTYLGLRLPAEITLPHRDYPLATIFAPASSYLSRDVPFPGITAAHSSTNISSAPRAPDRRPLPHPRTLFVHSTLSKLAKDDPPAYSVFVEGVTLLAWDIAWLCKVQGMSGLNSEIELCPIGRNLWNLLLADQKPLSPRNGSVSRDDSEATTTNVPSAPPVSDRPTHFGQLSHGTTLDFFGASEGRYLMRNWKLQSPARAIDKIKEFLRSEMQKAEWEILDGADWDGLGEGEEEPVLVGGQRFAKETQVSSGLPLLNRIAESKTNTPTRRGSPEIRDGSEMLKTPASAKNQGANGWTKVRTRNSEAVQP